MRSTANIYLSDRIPRIMRGVWSGPTTFFPR